jgi:hypothetical protein
VLNSGLRRADLGDEAMDDAEFDWFAHYKWYTDMATLPTPPHYRLPQPKAFLSLFRLSL